LVMELKPLSSASIYILTILFFFLEVKGRSTAMSYKEHCHVLAFKPSTIF